MAFLWREWEPVCTFHTILLEIETGRRLMATIKTRIKNRIDSSAEWNTYDPVLLSGEIAIESTGLSSSPIKIKVGNGKDSFTDLPYITDFLSNDFTSLTVRGSLNGTIPELSNHVVNPLSVDGEISVWWETDEETSAMMCEWTPEPTYDPETNSWSIEVWTVDLTGTTPRELSASSGASPTSLNFSDTWEYEGVDSTVSATVDMEGKVAYSLHIDDEADILSACAVFDFDGSGPIGSTDGRLSLFCDNLVYDDDTEQYGGTFTYSYDEAGKYYDYSAEIVNNGEGTTISGKTDLTMYRNVMYNPSISSFNILPSSVEGKLRDFYVDLSVGGDGVPNSLTFVEDGSNPVTFVPTFPPIYMGRNLLHFTEIAPSEFTVTTTGNANKPTLYINTMNELYNAVEILGKAMGFNVVLS